MNAVADLAREGLTVRGAAERLICRLSNIRFPTLLPADESTNRGCVARQKGRYASWPTDGLPVSTDLSYGFTRLLKPHRQSFVDLHGFHSLRQPRVGCGIACEWMHDLNRIESR